MDDELQGRASITYPALQPQANKVGIGWLTVTFFGSNSVKVEYLKSYVLEAYQYHFLDEINENECPGRGYRAGVRFASGTMFNWSSGRPDLSLSITQTAFDSVELLRAMRFMVEISALEIQVTRLDLYLDDFHQNFTVAEVARHMEGGWYVGKSRQFAVFQGKAIRDGKVSMDTVTVGRRGSSLYIRFYDKQVESNANVPWNRMEVELKKNRAHTAFDILVHCFTQLNEGEWGSEEVRGQYVLNTIKGLLYDSCDFRDPNSATRTNNRRRAAWYERMFMDVSKIPTMNAQNNDDIKKVEAWFRECVAPSLAVLMKHFGNNAQAWLADCLKGGESRLKPRQKRMLRKESA